MNMIFTDNLKKQLVVNLDNIQSIDLDINSDVSDGKYERYDIDFNFKGNTLTWSFLNEKELLENFEKIMAFCKTTNISKIVTL